MFDNNLVHTVVDRKDLDRNTVELRVNLLLTRGHGCYFPLPLNQP